MFSVNDNTARGLTDDEYLNVIEIEHDIVLPLRQAVDSVLDALAGAEDYEIDLAEQGTYIGGQLDYLAEMVGLIRYALEA
jgi:hypothetical protein